MSTESIRTTEDFIFLSRGHLPEIICFGCQEYNPIELGHIGRIEKDAQMFYFGVDHNEAILMLEDYKIRQNAQAPIILINFDQHSDIYPDKGISKSGITISNWLTHAVSQNLISNDSDHSGVVFIARPDQELSTELNFESGKLFCNNPNAMKSGVNLSTLKLNRDGQMNFEIEFLKLIRSYKNQEFRIAFSIDIDAGYLSDQYEIPLIDISQLNWVRSLIKIADITMTFRSPQFTSQIFAREQESKLLEIFQR